MEKYAGQPVPSVDADVRVAAVTATAVVQTLQIACLAHSLYRLASLCQTTCNKYFFNKINIYASSAPVIYLFLSYIKAYGDVLLGNEFYKMKFSSSGLYLLLLLRVRTKRLMSMSLKGMSLNRMKFGPACLYFLLSLKQNIWYISFCYNDLQIVIKGLFDLHVVQYVFCDRYELGVINSYSTRSYNDLQ